MRTVVQETGQNAADAEVWENGLGNEATVGIFDGFLLQTFADQGFGRQKTAPYGIRDSFPGDGVGETGGVPDQQDAIFGEGPFSRTNGNDKTVPLDRPRRGAAKQIHVASNRRMKPVPLLIHRQDSDRQMPPFGKDPPISS